VLDRRGGARDLDWAGVRAWQPDSGVLWMHLDRTGADTEAWLADESGLDPVSVEALLAEETRPRASLLPTGVLVILRGVNLNPGADPEDMVSLRVWASEHRVITMRRRPVMAALDVQEALHAGDGPTTAGALLVALTARLTDRIGPPVQDLDDRLDGLEVEAIEAVGESLRPRLAALRREAILLRRYLAPQRDALLALMTAPSALLLEGDRLRLREVADHVTRCVEDLDAIRERAAVTHDELRSRLAEGMNRRMYVLSLVAAVFLPLGLITGLLGVNLGGMPGAHSEWGFWILAGSLLVFGAATFWLLRRRRLF
jgi:zinc transporter